MISKVITINPEEDVNLCTKFHDISLETTIDVNLVVMLEKKLGITEISMILW